ncbi:hypothetical protein VPH35_025751 [Triticum aestivum]
MPATALTVTGWGLSPVIKELAEVTKSFLYGRYRSFKRFVDERAQLEEIVKKAEPIMERRRGVHDDETTRELIDAIDEVKGVLDAFLYQDILLANLAAKHNKLTQFAYSARRAGRQLVYKDEPFRRLEKVWKKLPTIDQKLQLFAGEAACEPMEKKATGPLPLPGDKLFVGYTKEYDQLMSALLNDQPSSSNNRRNMDVVAVVGPGGSGTTTMARRAINDHRVAEQFDLKVWVHVSNTFLNTHLLAKICKSMEGTTCQAEAGMLFSNLQQIVRERFSSKKFLLVLDDTMWEDVLASFEGGKPGSRILMTSQANMCVRALGAGTRIVLDGIGAADLALVLKQTAFGDEHAETPLLDDVIQSVAVCLRGSPSAAKAAVGKLTDKRSKSGWKGLLKPGSGHSGAGDAWSYWNLSPQLRSCLGFCSMFPDKWEFEPETLVKMWIANGIIRGDDNGNVEIGKKYIRDLQARSLFKSIKEDGRTYFVLPELVHSMLLSLPTKYFHRFSHEDLTSSPTIVPESVRHLSLIGGGCHALAKLKEMENPVLNKLKTLLVFEGSAIDKEVTEQLKAVTMLDLAGTQIVDLPKGIGKCKHLRYLGLPDTIRSLPAAVTKLLHLQTLSLGKKCTLDQGFPAHGMCSLINLRHLDMPVKYIGMTSHLGRLKQLQGSIELCADKGQRHVILQELAGMNSLHGTITVKGLHAVARKEEAQKARLEKKEHAKVLKFEWSGERACSIRSQEEVFEGLRPPRNIQELHIRRYQGTSSPSWLEGNHLKNLSQLHLINCPNCKVLPCLNQLPDLRVLHIKEMRSVGRIDRMLLGGRGGVLRSLQKLELDDMPNLAEWSVDSTGDAFPRLQEVHILNCPKLKHLPRIPSTVINLKIEHENSYLHMYPCSRSTSASFVLEIHGEAVERLQQDFLLQDPARDNHALSIKSYAGPGEVSINLLSSARSLSLSRCVVTDRQLEMFFQKLQSLEMLEISDCTEFRAFPDDAVPATLKSLRLKGCHPTLMEELHDRTSPTWARINSIPRVNIID